LAQVLRRIPIVKDPNVLVDLGTCDDAAVYRLSDDSAIVLTADFITPVVDDPYEFGRIAVTNALSDVYAMGGRPVVALNLAMYPTRTRPLDDLHEILRGGAEQAQAAGVSIVGGHSIDDPEPKFGLAVMGMVNPSEVITNAGAKPGDRLVLTKPVGVGIIATAIKKDVCPPDVLTEAVRTMTTLNGPAAEAMMRVGCSACTDVTGFGLLGHLHEMVGASRAGARVSMGRVPVIAGVEDLARQDMSPGGTEANLEYLESGGMVVWETDLLVESKLILSDAQTAGGLLIAVPSDRAGEMVQALESAGALAAADIGEIIADDECRITVTE
jgi:selenide,water dikinase